MYSVEAKYCKSHIVEAKYMYSACASLNIQCGFGPYVGTLCAKLSGHFWRDVRLLCGCNNKIYYEIYV